MQACERLRNTLRSLTPSELDGIHELKLLFARALVDKTLGALEEDLREVDLVALSFGVEQLTTVQWRAECEVLLARFAAITEAMRSRLAALPRQPVLQ